MQYPDAPGEISAPPIETGFDRASWVVLSLAIVLLALSLAQALYRCWLPGTGDWQFDFATESFVFDQDGANAPSPLKSGDVLLAVDGQLIEAIFDSALSLTPQRPASWAVGQTASLTVQREGHALDLDVTLDRRSTSGVPTTMGAAALVRPAGILMLLIGFFIFVRRPRNQAARLLLLFGSGVEAQILALALPSVLADLFYRGATISAVYSGTLFEMLVNPLIAHLFLVFPVVKWPMRRHSFLTLALLYGLMPALFLAAVAFGAHGPKASFLMFLTQLYPPAVLVLFLIAILSAVHSLRTVRGAGQGQIRWVAWGAVISLVGAGLLFLAQEVLALDDRFPLLNVVSQLVFLALPLSFAVAILRHRLFDIDILVNRTLVYGALTTMLLLLYWGGVVLMQQLFRALTGAQSDLAIVASTLAIAALFQPLRRRFQAFVDRRFFRRKYNAARILAAFGVGVRDEVDLTGLCERLTAVVGETIQPAHASLWLPTDSALPGAGMARQTRVATRDSATGRPRHSSP